MRSISSVAGLAATALLFSSLLGSAPAHAAPWTIDAAHTSAGFKVRHMMVSWVRGEFGEVTGTIDFDPAHVEASKADVTIDIATVDTRNTKRDEHLRSADFFDAPTFPKMTFKSKKVANITKAGFDLVGDLTIRGISKEVTLKVDGPSAEFKNPWGKTVRGFSASTTINRHDWKVSWNKSLDGGGIVVGDEVQIEIAIELNQ